MKAQEILYALTKPGAPFYYRPHYCVVPRLSFGLLYWECDLAVVTKSGWLWEVEIKASVADWKKDREKDKWQYFDNSEHGGVLTPKRFYYAAPENIAKRYEEFGTPAWAGVVAVKRRKDGELSAEFIRKACERENSRKLEDREMRAAARLGSMRFWTENHKAVQALQRKEQEDEIGF